MVKFLEKRLKAKTADEKKKDESVAVVKEVAVKEKKGKAEDEYNSWVAKATASRETSGKDSNVIVNSPLYVPSDCKDPRFYYRWINDAPNSNRLNQMLEKNYRIVTDPAICKRLNIESADPKDTRVRKITGNAAGIPLYSYLMYIPIEIRDKQREGLGKKIKLKSDEVRSNKNYGLDKGEINDRITLEEKEINDA